MTKISVNHSILTMDEVCEQFQQLSIETSFQIVYFQFFCLLIFLIIVYFLLLFIQDRGNKEIKRFLRKCFGCDIPPPSDEDVMNEILSHRGYLSTHISLQRFTDVVNENPQFGYRMLNPECYKNLFSYSLHSIISQESSCNLQILYCEPEGNAFSVQKNNVGHFICVFYDPQESTLNIYDSCVKMYTDIQKISIQSRLSKITYKLYPNYLKIVWRTPRTTQKEDDYWSCGVFSIAYCILIMFGLDPANCELDASNLREHISNFLIEYSSKTLIRKGISVF